LKLDVQQPVEERAVTLQGNAQIFRWNQQLIPAGEPSGLLTHIATTAFLELKSAIRASGEQFAPALG
jgi:hypothetical protein